MSDNQDVIEVQETPTEQSTDPYAGFETASEDTPQTLASDTDNDNEVTATEENAAPEADEAPDQTQAEKSKDSRKSRVQRRIDELVSEREDAKSENSRLKKELEALKSKQEPVAEQDQLTEDDFETYDEWDAYQKSLKTDKHGYDSAHKSDANKDDEPAEPEKKPDEDSSNKPPELNASQLKAREILKERFNNMDNLPKDFYEVVGDKAVDITPDMVEMLANCENSDKVLYYLGKNTDVAKDIANSTVGQQMMSIAKLDVQMNTNPPRYSQKHSSAPEPISPVGTSDVSQKPLSKMSFSEYEARRQEQINSSSSNGGW